MKRVFLLIVILLSMPSVLAAEAPPQIVVVREDAPSSDVVFAANFAAAMNSGQRYGPYLARAVFSSSTDRQLYETYTIEDLRRSVVILLDVENALAINVVGDATPSDVFIADIVATQYLAEKGFTIVTFLIGEPWQGQVGIWHEPTNQPILGNAFSETYFFDGQYYPFSYTGPAYAEGHVFTMEDFYDPPDEPTPTPAEQNQPAFDDDADQGEQEPAIVLPQEEIPVPTESAELNGSVAESGNPQEESQGLFGRLWLWLRKIFE